MVVRRRIVKGVRMIEFLQADTKHLMVGVAVLGRQNSLEIIEAMKKIVKYKISYLWRIPQPPGLIPARNSGSSSRPAVSRFPS